MPIFKGWIFFDPITFDGDTVDQSNIRLTIKGEAMKADSVNCRLAQQLFILMGRDLSALSPNRWEVKKAVEELAAAYDVETELRGNELWWTDPETPETPELEPRTRNEWLALILNIE